MRAYELMLLIKPDLDDEVTRGVVDKALGVITANGGTIEKEDLWGKRRLAYEIGRQRDGYYAVIDYKATANVSAELDRVLRIQDEVLRHMIVRPGEDE